MAVCNENTKSFLETILNSYDDIPNGIYEEVNKEIERMGIKYSDNKKINNEISDCPFCGKDQVSLTIGIGIVYVTCDSCLAAGPPSSIGIIFNDELYSSAKQEAVERWNKVSVLANKK